MCNCVKLSSTDNVSRLTGASGCRVPKSKQMQITCTMLLQAVRIFCIYADDACAQACHRHLPICRSNPVRQQTMRSKQDRLNYRALYQHAILDKHVQYSCAACTVHEALQNHHGDFMANQQGIHHRRQLFHADCASLSRSTHLDNCATRVVWCCTRTQYTAS